jgi:hypothetical protein
LPVADVGRVAQGLLAHAPAKVSRARFDRFDHDGGGTLGVEEIQEMMREMKLPADEAHIRKCFARFDEDESGDIDYDEFLNLWEYLVPKPPGREAILEALKKRRNQRRIDALAEFRVGLRLPPLPHVLVY